MLSKALRKEIKKILPAYKHAKTSYSQEGEDMIINRFFEHKEKGVYVDVGAHHPFRFSNTAFFYKKGWTGINIDPLPSAAPLFKKYRKRDINIQKGVSLEAKRLTYYSFNEPAYNTFDETKAKEYVEAKLVKPDVKKIQIETVPLSSILDEHIPAGTTIDFLSIDTEGLEMEVLKSNNWEKYQPTIIILESHFIEVEKFFNSELHLFMKDLGYTVVAKSYYSYFYKKTSYDLKNALDQSAH
jgi:FkbM family methyltransferase